MKKPEIAKNIIRIIWIGLAMLAVLFGGTEKAWAVPVTLSESAPQTVAGQLFSFDFTGVPFSNGATGTLTVDARGDYSESFSPLDTSPDPPSLADTNQEFLMVDIDGLFSDIGGSDLGTNQIYNSFNDVSWSQSYVIDGPTLNAITSDSAVTLSAQLSIGVSAIDQNSFLELSLTFDPAASGSVPEPGTLFLLGGGFLGLGLAGRRGRGKALGGN